MVKATAGSAQLLLNFYPGGVYPHLHF